MSLMDSIDLNSLLINPPSLAKLGTVKRKSERPQHSPGSKSTAQHPLTGVGLGRVKATALILGQMGKKNFSINHPIFKK